MAGQPTDSREGQTGLTRKEVKRQREILAGQNPARESRSNANRASRVVSGWVHDPAYQADDKQPAMLDFEGAGSFTELVRKYSGDMTPRAVLDELMRVGVAVEPDSGRLQLNKEPTYPPVTVRIFQIFEKTYLILWLPSITT